MILDIAQTRPRGDQCVLSLLYLDGLICSSVDVFDQQLNSLLLFQVCLHCTCFWSDRKWKNTHHDGASTTGTGHYGICAIRRCYSF